MDDTTLVEAQRQLWQLIVAPSGVAAALADRGRLRLTDALERRIRGDERLSAPARVEVYANAYFYRILECLGEDFAALRAGIGDARFHNLVTAYLIAHPPRHPSLRFAGDRLAAFTAGHDEASELRERFPWVGDLARLEWAIVDVFDASDDEVVSREDLAAVDPEQWGELRFDFQRSLTLLQVEWPVAKLRSAWDREEPMPTELDGNPGSLCVWRHDERVSYRGLEPLEAAALERARRGGSFGQICEGVAKETGDGEAPRHAAALMARWQADGLFRRLTTEPPDHP